VHREPIDPEVAAIFDPFGNAVHTALAFPMLGEDVLVTGAGPIGIMAAMISKHAGARHVVITDHSDERLALASKLGVTRAVNIDREDMADAQRELKMREGFDVGLEMSGSSAALRDMITQMTHGGRIAVLGIPSSEISVDVAAIVLKMLTIKGIYGREMYETWYEMSVLLESGARHLWGDHGSLPLHRVRASLRRRAFLRRRKGDHELGRIGTNDHVCHAPGATH
jgi:threonine 3-dehydrogenase